jgi:hypothetical protein
MKRFVRLRRWLLQWRHGQSGLTVTVLERFRYWDGKTWSNVYWGCTELSFLQPISILDGDELEHILESEATILEELENIQRGIPDK